MADQVWEGTVGGQVHRVEARGDFSRTVTWSIDGERVAEKKSMDDKVTLSSGDAAYDGSLQVRFSTLGGPRRATVLEGVGLGELGVGGVDLAPEPGSPAARHHEKLLAHPTRFTVIATLGGVAKVVVPILLAALVARFAVNLPWPDIDLPRIPFPDLPDIPWPDISLPDIDLPDVSLPGWLAWILDHANYVWPVVLAFVLARAEVTRRRKHTAQLEAQRRTAQEDTDDPEGETPTG